MYNYNLAYYIYASTCLYPNRMNAELISALEKSASPVPSQRQSGDAELTQLSTTPGFVVSLVGVFGDGSLNNSTRHLSLIYLKNLVDKKWRQAAMFPNDVKKMLRDNFLAAAVAPSTVQHPQMVKQLAVIIADVARSDFPRLWPQLLTELHQLVINYSNVASSGSPEDLAVLDAVLEVAHQTLKKLGTTRIGQARAQFDAFAVENIGIYWEIFKSFQQYKALKICGTLLSQGHYRAHRFQAPQKVFGEMVLALQTFSAQQNMKLMCRLGKIFSGLVEKHPLVFTGFGVDAQLVGQFYLRYLVDIASSGDTGRIVSDAKPLVQAMCIIRELTRFVKYEQLNPTTLPLSMRPRDDLDREEAAKGYAMTRQMFASDNSLPQLVQALIEFYFTMTPEDLELWKDAPDDFVIEESAQSPDFSVVLCAELLFAHILKAWPKEVAELAQHLIERAVQSGNELKVEGALRALQFGAATFAQSFDIAPVVQTLVQSGGVNSSSPIIRRRLCLVIGGWIPVGNNSSNLQAMAFELVKSTLGGGNGAAGSAQQPGGEWDIVVKLGALELTGICCDDIDFDQKTFHIAAQPVLRTVYQLLQSPDSSTEIKLKVLKTLSNIIEGMGSQLSNDDLERILQILPTLWETETERSNHHLVQGAVLHTLAELVTSCGVNATPESSSSRSNSAVNLATSSTGTNGGSNGSASTPPVTSREGLVQAYHVAVPLVDVATDPQQPLATYLMDDALALWKALLVNADQPHAHLNSLFGRLVSLIENNTEELGQLLGILESYLWFDYTLAIPYYTKLLSNFSLYLSESLGMNEALLVLLCAEILLNLSDGQQETMALQQSGLMQWMEQNVLSADNEDASMETMIEASACLNVLSLASVKTGGQGILHPETLVPSWLQKLRGVSDPRDRKLRTIGVTALLVAHPSLFAHFGSLYIDILSSIVDEDPDLSGFGFIPQNHEDDKLSAEEERKQLARSNEIAVTVPLRNYIKDAAQHMAQNGEPSFYNAALNAGIFYA